MSEGEITIGALVDRLKGATERMGRKNPHRALMLQAMSAIMDLSTMIAVQDAAEAEKPRIELAH